MKTKVTTMVAPGSFLVVICAVLVYSAGLGNAAPTELSKNRESGTEDGAYPSATTMMSPTPSNDAKVWPPQKPSRSSKHIIKSNLYKKPTKDKGGRAKEKPFYSSTFVPTGYDVEKDNLSRHKEAPSTGTVVNNVNGSKDYTNKMHTNSTILPHTIRHRTESISTNVNDDDDDIDDVVDGGSGGAGKDIDFISVAGTTKSDETYATATTTEGYHAKTEVASAASTTATMQTGLVENPNFNAEPAIAKMSTTKSVQDMKSILSSTLVVRRLTPTNSKSLPVNASVSSSSLSLSFSQSTVMPKLDVGHDGVKITKKKQLFDKHFIPAPSGPSPHSSSSSSSGSLYLPITKDNPWPPLSKNKPTKSGSGKKLMEVPNGYLGPIMMKEKTFSVSHRGKKPKSSIAEQLRDKKLVEIIAPTALMEPTIKVKSSIPPPEFVAIDSSSSSAAMMSTTTTTTEGPSVPPPVPTVATNKEEGIETATTYFLVVTQDSKTSSKEISTNPSAGTEMQPMNSGEIETTLREIYTEVLNAMEGGSKKKLTSTVVPHANEKIMNQDESPFEAGSNEMLRNDESFTRVGEEDLTTKLDNDSPRLLNSLGTQLSVTDRVPLSDTDHLPSTSGYDLRTSITDSDSDHHQSATTDRITDFKNDSFINHVTSSEFHHLTSPGFDRMLSSVTDHRSVPPTIGGAEQSTHQGSSTQLPSYPVKSAKLSTISIDGTTISDYQTRSGTDHSSMPTTSRGSKQWTSFPVTYQGSSTQLPSYPINSEKLSTISIDGSTISDRDSTSTPIIHHNFSAEILINNGAATTADRSFISHLDLPLPTHNTLTITDRGSTSSSVIHTDLSYGSLIKDDAQIVTDHSSLSSPITYYDSSKKQSVTSIPIKDHSLPAIIDDNSSISDRSSTSLPMIHQGSLSGQNITPQPITDHSLPRISKGAKPIFDRWSTVLPMFQRDSSTKQSVTALPLKDHISKVITEDAMRMTDHKDHLVAATPKNRDQIFSLHSLSTSTDSTPTITDRIPISAPIEYHDLTVKSSLPPIISHRPTITDQHFLPISENISKITDGSTASPIVYYDSSTDMDTSTHLSITPRVSDPSSTFATITTESYKNSPIIQQHSLKPTHDSEQTESKISDIQIEVYDSTVEPILASTNFKGNIDGARHMTTKVAASNSLPQERFTQYVVDKATDFATQDSNTVSRASGKPEPAAIEIHINVSEGFGNESEDLEFSYRQADYSKVTSKKPGNTNFITLKPFDTIPQNETSNEAAEEIVVEIIDSNSNSTENSASRENLNVNPIFTFRTDDDSQVELKNVKYYPEDRPKEGKKSTDDFFVPHVGLQPPGINKPMMDRDSDTIFYISNTEVKVGESVPTTNTYDAQLKKSRLESQFFPANYEERKKVSPQRYEEDIILSPLKNRVADPLKIVRGPLDISYVGESVMEVEQVTVTTTTAPPITGSPPDVIIQPAVLPEMAIGVPVIGELPPQIELKEIDFMPNFDGNKEESSIQYGGDLIDEGGAMGAGFDMDSYPLGNLGMGAISSQTVLNHRVNHLKKDELSADLAASSETTDGNDLLHRSNDSVNGTVIGEKMGNATAYSVMEEPPAGDGALHFTDLQTLFTACLATLLPLVLSVVMAFGLRHLYRKYQTNPFNAMGRNSSTDPLDAEKGAGGDGDADEVETPEELRASSLAFGATTDSPSLEIITSSNEVNSKPGDGDGRDCTGSIAANGRAAGSDMDVDCIQAIISDSDFQEENSIFIVNCNIETQPSTASAPPVPTMQPQSSSNTTTTTASNAAATPTAGTMQCNYSGANGSITTMTLKNNHLIVETEERNDISRDARETKMHYNNSEKDGVFVVEVSRGADSKIMPGSPVADSDDKCLFNVDTAAKIIEEDKLLSSHEEVQIHPPPPENSNVHDEIDSNHLHQIDEVDEFEEGTKITKHSNTGLSQSDLSSSSSVDSNKRYSYGNQELYTIEQQDYTTPSPAATKAPHPHVDPQTPQPENHNDDNGHSENGHVLENGAPSTPNCDSIYPADRDSDVNGQNGVESKPKITAALLKQDTVIVNELTNGISHEDDEEITPHNSMENLSNGVAPIIETCYGDTENGFDSIISLPDPPSTEEMKQMNDIILMETNQLDSLPPPSPPGGVENHHKHHNGNGIASEQDTTENGDSHSIASADASPMNTPTKVMSPPTITVALAPTDIPHTNGNCMTGHTATSNAGVVVEVSGSS